MSQSSSSSNGYLYDGFIEEPDKTPQEQHFENFKKFVSEFREQAREREQSLNDGDDASLGKLWSAFDDCIKFKFEPYETLRFDELLETDNKLLKKVTLVFATLCDEMDQLSRMAIDKFYPPLSIFGDSTNEQIEEGEKQLQFGRSIPLLMDLWNFCERVNTVVHNVVQQLAAIYSKKTRLGSYLNVHFLPVYTSLGELLAVLITLDEIIQQNQSFNHHLTLYNRMMSKVMEEPERFGTDKRSAGRIHHLLQKIDGDILYDSIFKTCITRNFEDEENGVIIQTNTIFQKEFFLNLESYFTLVATDLNNNQKETDNRYRLVGLCGVYMLYHTLFMDVSNKKYLKKLWALHKEVPIIHLYGNTVWSSGEFFLNKVPDMLRLVGVKNPRKEIDDARAAVLKNLDATLPAVVKSYDLNLAVWISRVESTFMVEKEGKDVVGVEGTLITQGMQLAFSISTLLRTAIYLHVICGKALTVTQVILLCRCIQMLKSIQATFHRKSSSFAKHLTLLTEFMSFKIQKLMLPLRNRLESKKKSNDTDVDQLSSTLLTFHVLSGMPSKKRLLLVRLLLCVSLQRTTGLLQSSEFDEVRALVQRLNAVSQFESAIDFACDCSLLYWSRLLVHNFFQNIFQNPERAAELKYMFAALHDPHKILKTCVHLKEKLQLHEAYKTEVLGSFEKNIIEPLCTEVETDLRLHIHSAVIQSNNSIAKLKGSLKDMTTFFKLRPIRFFDRSIEIKSRVSHYLDKTFYDLTAIAQHDHKTYEEMRTLASEKYGLDMTNVYLPGQTLEQGLDVLEITRNINVFVSQYSYNLNNNMFIERCSTTDAKNLNTIHIKHIANSIRTHGTGIMNTTVNFVFKYLGRKFYIFSQFLFDDHIKSRLIKDIRFYKDKSMELDNKYPLKQANSFVKYIKKLGSNPQGTSYLDQFRQLITEIGNALGYVRMVRAGGLRYISDAVKFVPDLDETIDFEKLVQVEQEEQGISMSYETQQAAKNLYQVCTNFSQKFAEGSDYFKTLESVFTQEMQKEHNNHLKNFFIIVPPLTINYVENMLISKDKMIRAGKESNFTNDGFALGVAFILKILNQNKRFNSLHWFESVAEHYNKESEQLKKTMSEKKSTSSGRSNTNVDDELQTMRLTMNRIKSYKREFELLFFSWSSSRVFFRDDL